MSEGDSEEAEYFTEDGERIDLKNEGIQWLTSFQEDTNETATRLKVIKVSNQNILILFEVWEANSYKYTVTLGVDRNGNILQDP